MNDELISNPELLKDIKMKITDIDMFGVCTITFDQAVRTIKDFELNIFRDFNSSNLNLEIFTALN